MLRGRPRSPWASATCSEGKDIINFFVLDPNTGHLAASGHAWQDPLWASHFMYVPQAWSLGIEFSFYLLAPFLFRLRTGALWTVALASFGLKVSLSLAGYQMANWTWNFFPAELGTFILGMLAYRAYAGPNPDFWLSLSRYSAALMIPLLAFNDQLPFPEGDGLRVFGTLGVVALSLPYIFDRTKDNAHDHFVGELSYPLYLCHLVVNFAMFASGVPFTASTVWVSICVNIFVAIALVVFVEHPTTAWRRRMSEKLREWQRRRGGRHAA